MKRLPTVALLLACLACLGADDPDKAPKRVQLPFGESIQPGLMNIDQQRLEGIFRQEHEQAVSDNRLTPVYLSKTDGGTPTGAHAQKLGKFYGPSVRVDDEGRMRSLVEYVDGKRQGTFRGWDEKEPRLYAQYKNNLKDGVLCYYSGGKPAAAQKWKAGKLIATCLIVKEENAYKAIAEDDLDDKQKTVLNLCLGDVVQFENEVAEAEKATKKECLAWFKKEDEARKKRLAAANSVQARNAARERAAERQSQDAAALGEILSRGARSAGW